MKFRLGSGGRYECIAAVRLMKVKQGFMWGVETEGRPEDTARALTLKSQVTERPKQVEECLDDDIFQVKGGGGAAQKKNKKV